MKVHKMNSFLSMGSTFVAAVFVVFHVVPVGRLASAQEVNAETATQPETVVDQPAQTPPEPIVVEVVDQPETSQEENSTATDNTTDTANDAWGNTSDEATVTDNATDASADDNTTNNNTTQIIVDDATTQENDQSNDSTDDTSTETTQEETDQTNTDTETQSQSWATTSGGVSSWTVTTGIVTTGTITTGVNLGSGLTNTGSGIVGSGLVGTGIIGSGVVGTGAIGTGIIGTGVIGTGLTTTGNTWSGDDLTIAEIEAASPPPPVSDDKLDLVIYDENSYIDEFENEFNIPRALPQIEELEFFQIKPEDIIDQYSAQGGKVHVTTTQKGTFLRVKLK